MMSTNERTVRRWCERGDVPGAYRTKGGHWRLRRPSAKALRFSSRDDSRAARLAQIVASLKPAVIRGLKVLTDISDWNEIRGSAFGCNKRASAFVNLSLAQIQTLAIGVGFTECRQIGKAIECSWILRGEIPGECDVEELRLRNPELYRKVCYEPLAEFILPEAWRAIDQQSAPLFLAMKKLEIKDEPMTPQAVARQLGISVATLYRQFKPQQLKDAKRVCERYGIVPAKGERGRKVNTRHVERNRLGA